MSCKDISELMRLKGWTQADLARKLELSEGAISRWFKGDHAPQGPARILMRLWLDAARAEAKPPSRKPSPQPA